MCTEPQQGSSLASNTKHQPHSGQQMAMHMSCTSPLPLLLCLQQPLIDQRESPHAHLNARDGPALRVVLLLRATDWASG